MVSLGYAITGYCIRVGLHSLRSSWSHQVLPPTSPSLGAVVAALHRRLCTYWLPRCLMGTALADTPPTCPGGKEVTGDMRKIEDEGKRATEEERQEKEEVASEERRQSQVGPRLESRAPTIDRTDRVMSARLPEDNTRQSRDDRIVVALQSRHASRASTLGAYSVVYWGSQDMATTVHG